MFERAIEVEGQTIRGHIQGDPVTCIPYPKGKIERDARARRAARRAL
jgi:hypothetical protein